MIFYQFWLVEKEGVSSRGWDFVCITGAYREGALEADACASELKKEKRKLLHILIGSYTRRLLKLKSHPRTKKKNPAFADLFALLSAKFSY